VNTSSLYTLLEKPRYQLLRIDVRSFEGLQQEETAMREPSIPWASTGAVPDTPSERGFEVYDVFFRDRKDPEGRYITPYF
jgi:hypothetical protein